MGIHKLNQKKKVLLSDRLFVLALTVTVMFITVSYQFYKLQIIEHATYEQDLRASVQRQVDIPAIRGLIYDRYGKPLVSNKPIYVLKMDPQVTFKKKEQMNQTLLKVAKLLEENGDTYIDNMPISKTTPFVFTEDAQSIRTFITNYVPYDNQEHKEQIYKYTATELINYLRGEKVFNIEKSMSDVDTRKILAMRLEIGKTVYQKYKKVTLANDISMETLAAIEENQSQYPSIISEVESQRYYTYGKEFGNILGYTRTITESQYNTLKEKGYEKDDLVGQVGIESTMESELKGQKGSKIIEVDNLGKTVFTPQIQEAKSGNNVYLTIDSELQLAVYKALEKRFSEGIIGRLQGKEKTKRLTGRDVLISMAKNNQLDFKIMKAAPSDQIQKQLYDKVEASYEAALEKLDKEQANIPEEEKKTLSIKEHFANLLDSKEHVISNQELLLALGEQKSLKFDEEQMKNIRAGNYGSIESIIIAQLESGQLKPDQTAITPCSGSAVVVDVNTGEALAIVGYPTLDSNEFTQNFNSIYTKLHDNVDERNLEINRALKTAKAPGSTFKMLTAVAGLEEGVITPDTLINDLGVYNKVGKPGPVCWIYTNTGHGHGSLNLQRALEVSCNYFFYEVAYRLGTKYGGTFGGINALSKYVKLFGLDESTGIELDETAPNISNPQNAVNTQISRALNYLNNLKDKSKEDLYAAIEEYLEIGFYTLGDSEAVDIEGKVDYYSRPYIKDVVDQELALVLSEDLGTIFDKTIEDFKDELDLGISDLANELTQEVFAGDDDLSLKLRTKEALAKKLMNYIQPGTRKSVKKSLEKMPEGILKQAYYEGYEAALNRYQSEADMKEVCAELEKRMTLIESNQFDYESLMINKVLERIITVYLNRFFEDVEMEWKAADNVRTAIGQGQNTFTPVQMARYIAGLANGKTVYDLKIVGGIDDNKVTGQYKETPTKIYNTLNLKQSTLSNIYEGMHRVAFGSSGTARSYFEDSQVQVAAKTGTAQEGSATNGTENSWFAGFAPYDHPQIAVVTSMYGSDGLGSLNTKLAKDIFDIYFKVNEERQKVTLDSQFVN